VPWSRSEYRKKCVPFALNQAKKINTFCFSRFQALLPKETNLPNSEKPEQIQTTSPSGENNFSDDK
jgi:hypothetical protein